MQVGGEGECVIGEPLNWFTTVHVLPPCAGGTFYNTWSEFGAQDVDGDGRNDHLVLIHRVSPPQPDTDCTCSQCFCLEFGGNIYNFNTYAIVGGLINGTGNTVPFPFSSEVGVYRYSLSRSGSATTVTYECVLSGTVLNAAVCAVAPCNTPNFNCSISPKQFHDWDGDGDLDLVAELYWYVYDSQTASKTSYGLVMIVVENTVKSDPPLAADINGDGIVDGKDLASVLSAWTP
jgi:hypothetical protein